LSPARHSVRNRFISFVNPLQNSRDDRGDTHLRSKVCETMFLFCANDRAWLGSIAVIGEKRT
jgi:hypothetical protein